MKMRTVQNHSAVPTTSGRPRLSSDHHELLKSALGLKTADDRSTADLRPVIREIVNTCAPTERPEQILVAFKSALNDVANNARMPFGPERNARLSSLVSAFIEEMYARGPGLRDGACRGK